MLLSKFEKPKLIDPRTVTSEERHQKVYHYFKQNLKADQGIKKMQNDRHLLNEMREMLHSRSKFKTLDSSSQNKPNVCGSSFALPMMRKGFR